MIATFQGGDLDGVVAAVDLDNDPKVDNVVGILDVGWVTRQGQPKNGLVQTIKSHRYRVLEVNGNNVRLFVFSNGS